MGCLLCDKDIVLSFQSPILGSDATANASYHSVQNLSSYRLFKKKNLKYSTQNRDFRCCFVLVRNFVFSHTMGGT
jgi:hypothetical protein